MEDESLYIHAFNAIPNFGLPRLFKLHHYFKNFKEAYNADIDDYIQAEIESEAAAAIIQYRTIINLKQEQEKLDILGIGLVSYNDPRYPLLLKEIPKPPLLLYIKGSMGTADELCIAVVGTRKITTYGRVVTPFVCEPLIGSGAVIVSGLAYGVDSAVQQLAVSGHKRTIAVLGGGLDDKSFYPKEHAWLADQIIETGGAIISEYPPGTPPLKHHFIARNRIISGMSVATVVIECDLKSGSLITAKYALEQNRTVYAVPGPIYSEQSKGPNNLIKMGAKLVTEAADILNDLNIEAATTALENKSLFGDTPAETSLLQILSFEPVGINELIKQSGLEAGDTTSALTFLEMKGLIRNLGGQQYVRTK